MKPIAIIEAPSILGLRPTGVEHLPQALIDAGLAGRLNARHAGRVDSPAYSEERDNKTGFLNPNGIAEYSCKLAQRIGQVLEQGSFALVLGGRLQHTAWSDARDEPSRPARLALS